MLQYTIPPGDLMMVHLPKKLMPGAYSINWAYKQSLGVVGKLNLMNSVQVSLNKFNEFCVLYFHIYWNELGKSAF